MKHEIITFDDFLSTTVEEQGSFIMNEYDLKFCTLIVRRGRMLAVLKTPAPDPSYIEVATGTGDTWDATCDDGSGVWQLGRLPTGDSLSLTWEAGDGLYEIELSAEITSAMYDGTPNL